MGSSGCGKSTVLQLLLRFYLFQKGNIYIDGIDIREIDLYHLRRQFGTVIQEPVLFNGTIEYNVRYNELQKSEKDLELATKQANAYDFIVGHEDGFKRNVGNFGEEMSGGQKQRISIARCIVRRPRVYLFDEATSALDVKSEKIV